MAAGRRPVATGTEKRGTQRPEDAGIPLAAGRIACFVICAGIEDANADVGQAPAKGVGIDTTVKSNLHSINDSPWNRAPDVLPVRYFPFPATYFSGWRLDCKF